MKFHHVGCLTRDLGSSIASYSQLLGAAAGEPRLISNQKVTVCFVPLHAGAFLELVHPQPEATGLLSLLETGQSFYHLAFKAPNLQDKVDELSQQGYDVLTIFRSEAFDNALCVFLKTPGGELIELIEEVLVNE